MLESVQVLLLKDKIAHLERELAFYRSPDSPISRLTYEEPFELSVPHAPVVHIPLYFNARINVDKLKLNFKAYIVSKGEFSYYCDVSQLDAYQEAQVFDDIISKLIKEFFKSVRQK